MNINEPTNGKILEALNNFAEGADKRFDSIDKRFDHLEQKVDQNHLELSGQIRMIEIELKDIKERLIKLENRTIEDADASAQDILELRKRVDLLENQVRQLQTV